MKNASQPDRLRWAVAGVGAMGANHARVCAQLSQIELVGIVDPNSDTAADVATRYRSRAYADIAAMVDAEKPDVVTVAVPTIHHFDVAMQALEAGCHVLIEKPLCSDLDQGRQLIETAKQRGLVLGTGHIERFNPAVSALKARLESGQAGRIYQVTIRRMGPLPQRITDVGVLYDLATHDIDLLFHILDSDVVSFSVEAAKHLHTAHEDLASILLRFDNGVIGVLQENWLSPTKIRDITLNGERGMFIVDLVNQDLMFYENQSMTFDGNMSDVDGMSAGNMIRYQFIRDEPLRLQIEAFARAVTDGTPPPVSGEDGLRAAAFAQALADRAEH